MGINIQITARRQKPDESRVLLLEEVLHADQTPQDEEDFSITEDQKKELDSIRNRHHSGEGESFTLDEIR